MSTSVVRSLGQAMIGGRGTFQWGAAAVAASAGIMTKIIQSSALSKNYWPPAPSPFFSLGKSTTFAFNFFSRAQIYRSHCQTFCIGVNNIVLYFGTGFSPINVVIVVHESRMKYFRALRITAMTGIAPKTSTSPNVRRRLEWQPYPRSNHYTSS